MSRHRFMQVKCDLKSVKFSIFFEKKNVWISIFSIASCFAYTSRFFEDSGLWTVVENLPPQSIEDMVNVDFWVLELCFGDFDLFSSRRFG